MDPVDVRGCHVRARSCGQHPLQQLHPSLPYRREADQAGSGAVPEGDERWVRVT